MKKRLSFYEVLITSRTAPLLTFFHYFPKSIALNRKSVSILTVGNCKSSNQIFSGMKNLEKKDIL